MDDGDEQNVRIESFENKVVKPQSMNPHIADVDMIFLKKEISEVAKGTLFQNNVPATWDDFKGKAEPILSSVKNRFGLTDYRLVLDETTTTPDLIDRNIMYAKVYLKPARAIEYIAIDFVITKTGADFV